MSALPAFSSVKLSSALVTEAKQAAQTLRRSTAGQIEYWALLGKAVEDGGLTTREAASALNQQNDKSLATTAQPLGRTATQASQASAIVAQFTEFSATGALAQHVRHVIAQNAHPKQALKA
jgi:ParD-like antitoxin of type II bacterial toxin-antitoxin system